MHNVLAQEPSAPTRNGSLKTGVTAISSSEGTLTKMQMDEIQRILTALEKQGGVRDVQMEYILKGLERQEASLRELAKQKQARVEVTDEWHRTTLNLIDKLGTRVERLESNGISSWGMKKVTQWAGLITACGILFGAAFALILWLFKHFHA